MPTTLGLHSPRLAAVRALGTKAGRREQGCFAVEGSTALEEGLRAGRVPESVYVTEAALARLGPIASAVADRLIVIPPRAMERLSELSTPPGVVAVYPTALDPLAGVLERGRPALVVGVADPGNAGTLLRSAEIFGIGSAIFSEGAVEPYNPKVVRATMGAIFRMRLAVANRDALLESARAFGYAVIALSRSGTPLPGFRFAPKSLFVVGHERRGVSDWSDHADHSVAVPHVGSGESLNAAVAGGIVFYAFSLSMRDARKQL